MILRSFGTLALLAGALLFVGCDPPNPEDVLGNSGESSESQSDRKCRDSLKNALSSLAPDRLEISADVESTVDVLNRWLTDCGSPEKISPKELQQIEQYSSATTKANLARERFTERDAGFLRNAILCHEIVEQVTLGSKNDLDRTQKLFQFVVRNVVLTPDTQALPLTLYEILLFGRGSEAQQAWVFSELLRQLRIDSAKLETKGADSAQSDWVYAVFLDEGTFLFDFHLQIPVPNEPKFQQFEKITPASIAQVFDRPELLDSLRELGSHVPTSDALKSAEIQILAESSHWARRMKALNSQLVGEKFLIFDGLLDHEGGEGAVSRVESFVKPFWIEPNITVSDLPDRQTREYWEIEPNSSKSQAIAARKQPFSAPIELTYDPKTNESQQIPSQQQWSARLAQLQGKFSDSVRNYGTIRLDENKKSSLFAPEDLKNAFVQMFLRIHQSAAQDAHFWVAMSQVDLEEYEEAADTLADYQKRFPQGRWSDVLPYVSGKNYLRLGDTQRALEFLESIRESSQFHLPASYLLKVIESSKSQTPDTPAPPSGEKNESKPTE